MEILKLWAIIVRRKRIFISVFLTVLLVPVIFSFLIKPVYKCKTKVWAMYKPLTPMLVNPSLPADYGKFSYASSDYLADTFVKLIESRTVVDNVIKKLNVRDKRGNLFDLYHYVEPGYVAKMITQKECLEAVQMDDSEVFEIKAYSTDIERAVNVANEVADEFLKLYEHLNQNEIPGARKILEEEVARVRREWYEAERQRMEFRTKKLAVNLETQKTNLINQLSTLYDSKHGYETTLASDKATLASLEETFRKNKQPGPDDAIDTGASSISNYQSKLYDLEVSLADKLTQYKDNHPSVRTLRAEIEYTKNSIKSMLQKSMSSEGIARTSYFDTLVQKYGDAMVESTSVMAKNHAIDLQIAELERKQREVIALDHEYSKITEQTDVLKATLSAINQQLQNVKTADNVRATNANIVERAVVPTVENAKYYIYFPNKKLIAAIALFFGIFLAFCVVLFLDFVDDTLRTRRDVENFLKLPVLASIPDCKAVGSKGDHGA